MDLIYWVYYNVWPFKDKLIKINFKKWKYLIKSPIWTWKSFLFFDVPLYALYWRYNRVILNKNSDKWFVYLIFLNEDKYFLIYRSFSKWIKLKTDIVKLYELLNFQEDYFLHEPILKFENFSNVDFSLFKPKEFLAKWKKDIDSLIEDLLPSYDVITSVNFLLQDSNNIFELTSKTRVEILKNMFNLIQLDIAIQKIREYKKEIDAKLKLLDSNISSLEKDISILVDKKKQFNELFLKDNIDKFLYEKKSEYLYYKSKLSEYEDNLKNINEQLEFLKNKRKTLINEKIKILEKIKNFDEYEQKKLRQKKEEIKNEIERIKNEFFSDKEFNKYWVNNDFHEVNKFFENLIFEWKKLKSEIDLLLSKIENVKIQYFNFQKDYESKIQIINNEIDNIKDKIDIKKKQLENLEKEINWYNEIIKKETNYHCIKISQNCPFIVDIKKEEIDKFLKLIKNKQEEKEEILKSIDQLNSELYKLQYNLNEIKKEYDLKKDEYDLQWKVEKINNEIKKIEQIINEKRFIYKTLWWQSFNLYYEKYKKLSKELEEIDSHIDNIEKFKSEYDKYKDILLNLDFEIQKIDEKVVELEKFYEQITNQINEINKNIDNDYILKNIEKLIIDYEDYKKINITLLVKNEELNNIKTEKSIFSSKKEIIKDLDQIFSKDLIYIIIKKHIEIIFDIMNIYLSKIVDFEIIFDLKEEEWNVELEIYINDDKWKREIKSLSWWQKSILKIAWILAVSSYLQVKFLFLDETINSLDIESIWKVSSLIKEFVENKNLKFYIVTHSPEIQQMNIWDEIITLI